MIGNHTRVYKCLNAHDVRYLVVGGTAAIIYGVPRATLDVDLFVERTLTNAARLLDALKDADFGTAHLTTPEAVVENQVTIFDDYFELDAITELAGVGFAEAWQRREVMQIQDVPVPFIALADLIAAKAAAGREKDLADLDILRRIAAG